MSEPLRHLRPILQGQDRLGHPVLLPWGRGLGPGEGSLDLSRRCRRGAGHPLGQAGSHRRLAGLGLSRERGDGSEARERIQGQVDPAGRGLRKHGARDYGASALPAR